MPNNSKEYTNQRRKNKREQGLCTHCPEKALPGKSLCKSCAEASAKKGAEHNFRAKVEALTHYSPDRKLKCSWTECEVTDIDCLTLDHVNNNGAEDRANKTAGRAGHCFYARVRKEGFPAGFQTLCWNHQAKKEIVRRRKIRLTKHGLYDEMPGM